MYICWKDYSVLTTENRLFFSSTLHARCRSKNVNLITLYYAHYPDHNIIIIIIISTAPQYAEADGFNSFCRFRSRHILYSLFIIILRNIIGMRIVVFFFLLILFGERINSTSG